MACSALSFVGEHEVFVGIMFAIVVIALLAGWSDYLDRKRGELHHGKGTVQAKVANEAEAG